MISSAFFWIEISSGLISYNYVWMMNKCSCYSCTLKLSSWEWFYKFIFLCEKSYLRKNLRNSFMDGFIIVSWDFHGKSNIFFYGFAWQKFKILKYNSNFSSIREKIISGEIINISFVNISDFSLFRLESSNHASYEACFSAPWTSYEKKKFSWFL